jgi:hypothetical protein
MSVPIQGSDANRNAQQLQRDIDQMVKYGVADDEAKQLLNDLKKAGIYQGGHTNVGYLTLQDWKAVLNDPNRRFVLLDNRFSVRGDSQQVLNDFLAKIDAALARLGPAVEQLQTALSMAVFTEQAAKNQEILASSFAAIKRMMESGDIEGAVMMLQTGRAKMLEEQLSTRMDGMRLRMAESKALNDALVAQQNLLAGSKGPDGKMIPPSDEKKAEINAKIQELKGKIDGLNTESQIDMIGIQSLVNKRNEAFELLSSLLAKFQKLQDSIVRNV